MGTKDKVFERKMQALMRLLNLLRQAKPSEWAVMTRIEQVDQKAFNRALRLAEMYELADTDAKRDKFRERYRDEVLSISFNAFPDVT